MIPDRTGRFPKRPYYEVEELEEECERIMESFLMSRYGQYSIPVPTDALVELLDRETAKLNLYCDLSGEGEEVHGVTEFLLGEKPQVSIARELSYQLWREHRKRNTLTHEYGHVHWHTWLFDRYCKRNERHKCLRAQIIAARRHRLDGVACGLRFGRHADAQEPCAIARRRIPCQARCGESA